MYVGYIITRTYVCIKKNFSTSKFQIYFFNTLSNNLVSDVYVGTDGKLHKVVGGADSVLPFSLAYPAEIMLYSNSSISIPMKGTTLSFKMETLHPYINFYVDGLKNGTSSNLFTQTAGGNYTGNKSINISNFDTVRFRATTYNTEYSPIGHIKITNIKVN